MITGTTIALQDAVELQDGLNTFTNVLIHAEPQLRKTIAQHVQVCRTYCTLWNLPDHYHFVYDMKIT